VASNREPSSLPSNRATAFPKTVSAVAPHVEYIGVDKYGQMKLRVRTYDTLVPFTLRGNQVFGVNSVSLSSFWKALKKSKPAAHHIKINTSSFSTHETNSAVISPLRSHIIIVVIVVLPARV
jgi:hypothetical protein